MPAAVTVRPTATDHAEYYARYLDLVPAGNLVAIMRDQIDQLDRLLRPLTETEAETSYQSGKWTIKEVVGHLIDTERVFAFRATAFSRGDTAPLPSFDQAAWNPFGRYQERTLTDLLDEWATVRRASVALITAMPEEGLARRGVASGFEFSALAALAILPGHLLYHINHLTEHYLPVVAAR